MFLYLFVYTAIKTLFLCSTPNPQGGFCSAFSFIFHGFSRAQPSKNLCSVYSMVYYMLYTDYGNTSK